MKQVLQVCAYAGGGEGNFIKSLKALQQTMLEAGYETIYALLETSRDKQWCKDLQKTNRVYFLPHAKARIKPATYLSLRKIFRENDIAIVHTHFELYDIPVAVTAPKSVRIFWHLHDPIGAGLSKAPWSRRVLTKLHYSFFSKRATLLTTAEKHGDFAATLGFPKERIVFIPNGLDTQRMKPVENLERRRSFLIFCWDYYRKGGDLATAAGRILWQKAPGFKISFVGGGVPR